MINQSWKIVGLLLLLAGCNTSQLPEPTAAELSTQDATCATWQADQVYNRGNVVLYNEVIYKANWWTQNNNPALNNGASGSGQPWTIVTEGCSPSGARRQPPTQNRSPPRSFLLHQRLLTQTAMHASATSCSGVSTLETSP